MHYKKRFKNFSVEVLNANFEKSFRSYYLVGRVIEMEVFASHACTGIDITK